MPNEQTPTEEQLHDILGSTNGSGHLADNEFLV